MPSKLALDLTDNALRWLAIVLDTAGDFKGIDDPDPLIFVKCVLNGLGLLGNFPLITSDW